MEENLKVVFETNDPIHAEIIRNALQSEGIRCALENELQAGFTGILSCRISVLEKDAGPARAIIEHGEEAVRSETNRAE